MSDEDRRHEGVETIIEDVQAAGRTWRLCRLANRAQFHDPDGEAAAMGVHENVWPLFGILWPSAASLCNALSRVPLHDDRVLELGCGLALVSMSLHARGIEVLASDVHPRAGEFLAHNAELNGLSTVPFERIDWTQDYPSLAPFSVIVASDVLYEDDMVPDIVRFIERHSAPHCRVFMVDPGRAGRRNRFTEAMREHGFRYEAWQPDPEEKLRVMRFERGTEA